MKTLILLLLVVFADITSNAQTNPAITSWLINTTNIMGRHYVKGNSTPINDNVAANVQKVQYSATSVYVSTNGIPAYITGPFLDGNPSLASSQNAIFKIPLTPIQNTGTPTNTTGGNIGIFINGVALFDYRDGVSWQNSTNSLKGGPIMGVGDGVWNRDAVVGERLGFDCAKAHPAMGNYHHHQNPSAFNLDLKVISTVCDLYAADGLYAIDSSKHSPLIGFAYDGFPIYGAYAYKNTNGTGEIVRMKSSYVLRNITTRTTYANGSTVTAGPAVSTTYPLGYFREDYQYNATSAATPDYLDEHNGRFCVTPEYPNGIYCYFATVDANWNSAYPYVVGPTFYGVKSAAKVASISESVTTYTPSAPALTVSTNTLMIPALANNSKTFDITSNVDWTISCNQPWITVDKLNGNGNSTITITAEENVATSTRKATITVAGIGVTTQTITVTQDEAGIVLSVSKSTLTIAAPANSTKTFDITSNTTWMVVSDQMWLTINKSAGNGNETITLTAQGNITPSSRMATVTVTGIGATTQTITVTQDGTAPTLSVSKTLLSIAAPANSTALFGITSNTNWSITSNQTWLNLNNLSGNGDATIILTAQENPDTTKRMATITVSAIGTTTQIVSVTQEGKVSTGIAENTLLESSISIFPNPTSNLIAIQINTINYENIEVELYDAIGRFLQTTKLFQGSTIAYFDTKTLYNGEYIIRIPNARGVISKKFILNK
jgi:hypothetical protein